MASDYWKTSPFGENSIFHPSWEEKEKERRRQKIEPAKITGIKIERGTLKEDSYDGPRYDNLDPQKYLPDTMRYLFVKVSIIVTIYTSGYASTVFVAIDNDWKQARQAYLKTGTFQKSFTVQIPSSKRKGTFVISAKIADSLDSTPNDMKKYKVEIDDNGCLLKKNEIEDNKMEEENENLHIKTLRTNNLWKPDDLQFLVTELRKQEILIENGKAIRDNKGKIVGYEDFTCYNDKTSDGKQIKDRLFYLKKEEKINENEATYANLSKQLCDVFNTYKINTCLRRIHFMAQVWVETQRLASTRESLSYEPDSIYKRGRGLLQLTHKSNYKKFYQHLFQKEPSDQELEFFAPQVATSLEYAVKSAGWYWNQNNVNLYADKDDVERVSAAINYPESLKRNPFNPDGINRLTERKKYTQMIKNILGYETISH